MAIGIEELGNHVEIILRQLRVKCRKSNLLHGNAALFAVEDFGTMICCINRIDYGQANTIIMEHYKSWRTVHVTTNDNLLDIRLTILWSLMRGGYMRWMRFNFPRQIRNVLTGQENLGQRIIEERLRVWADRPKYKFLIEDNKDVLKNGIIRVLADDPGFFDYMPEEE